MNALPTALTRAAQAASDRLSGFANDIAVAGAAPGRTATQSSMAAAARQAIFADALLSAMHARLEEVKSVAK